MSNMSSMNSLKKSALLILSTLAMQVTIAKQFFPIDWPIGKSAVAWQTRKTLFLVNSVQPVGINTDIKASVTKADNARIVKIVVPIAKFNSGEPDRDKEVLKILKADIQPAIEFISNPINEKAWQDLMANELKAISGKLSLAGQEFPVSINVEVSGEGIERVLNGRLEARFTDFKIPPPAVAGGLIANVKDVLNLHVHIFAKDVVGF